MYHLDNDGLIIMTAKEECECTENRVSALEAFTGEASNVGGSGL